MTLTEIESRLSAITAEMDGEGANLEAFAEEVRKLNDEKFEIEKHAAERRELLETIKNIKGDKIAMSAETEKRTYGVDSAEYRAAWLNTMKGSELTAEQRDAMTSGTSSVGYAIPTVTQNLIVENMKQIAPMIGEIDLLHVAGNVTIAVEDTVNDAAIHTEGAAVTPSSDTITKVSLGGYEIMKLLSMSAKVNTMTIDAFEGWVVSNLSRKLAEVIENYIINGTGSSQPKGIDLAETWADGTNAVDYSSAPTIAEFEELIGYLNPAYANGAKFLMNWKTFWTKVHTLRDDNTPDFITNANGGWYIFGIPVIMSSKVVDGDIFYGNFREGVKGNMAQDVAIESSAVSGFRSNSTDYRGTCIFDCTTIAGRIVKMADTL